MSTITDIGFWSELKLAIIKEYAAAYSRILSAQKSPPLTHIYIDAFAGAGMHISRTSGNLVSGSPAIAIQVSPPFREYHFIDLDGDKAALLRRSLAANRNDVWVYEGDANDLLLKNVFPRARYEDYRRGLCLLDPYGLHYTWQVVQTAGSMRSLDLIFNFPMAAINRNVLHRDPAGVTPQARQRMHEFWGDDSWRQAAYTTQRSLFGDAEKLENMALVQAYQERLKNIAGFNYVSQPLPIRNSRHAVIYYLFLASHKPVASDIINQIFDKYRRR